MLIKLVRTDLLKLKTNFIWKFILLVPLMTTVLMQLLILIQFKSINEFCNKKGVSGWILLISQNSGPVFWPSIINIIIMIISITVYQVEFKHNSLNTQICFPISRSKILLSKFTVIFIFTFITILLNLVGLIILGKLNNISDSFPFIIYGKYLLFQCCSVIGTVAISNWISSLYKNPIISYVIGILGFSIGTILPHELKLASYFFPYSYPVYASGLGGFNPRIAVLGGLISGAIVLIVSIYEFMNRDIK